MNIIKFINKKTAINCKTLKEAEQLMLLLEGEGYKWSSGRSYVANNCWKVYGDRSVYYPYEGMYSDLKDAEKDNYNIIYFEDIIKKFPVHYLSKLTIQNCLTNGHK